VAEPPATVFTVETLHHLPGHVAHLTQHQLRDAVAAIHVVAVVGIGVHQQHLHLASVAGVDDARRVQHGDAMVQGQPTARHHEAHPPHGNGHRDTGGNQHPSSVAGYHDVVTRHQVQPRVARARIGRKRKFSIEANDLDGEHVHDGTRTPNLTDVLVWMDLEMTGLNPETDVIVEIATLVTDDELNVVAEGPDLIIHQSDEVLARMDAVVVEMHTKSGLLPEIRTSTLTLEQAGAATMDFLREHISEARSVPLAGSSIGTDRRFLARYLPDIEHFLHYRCVDVSTVKELVKRWYPTADTARPRGNGGHRAMADIKVSIEELRWYREHVFVPGTPSP